MADLGIVEDVAELLRQVCRGFGDRIAHRDFRQAARKGDAVVATREARAQGVGFAFAGFVGGGRASLAAPRKGSDA